MCDTRAFVKVLAITYIAVLWGRDGEGGSYQNLEREIRGFDSSFPWMMYRELSLLWILFGHDIVIYRGLGKDARVCPTPALNGSYICNSSQTVQQRFLVNSQRR